MSNLRKVSEIFFLLLTFEFCLLTLGPAKGGAIDMSSDYYKIKDTTLSIIKNQNTTKDSQNSDIREENYLTAFTSSGYSIKSGLPYLKSANPFTFSLATTKIEFTPAKNNLPSTKNLEMIVKNGSIRGYQIFIDQLSPFTSDSDDVLPQGSFTLGMVGQTSFTPLNISKGNKQYTISSSELHNLTRQNFLTFTLKIAQNSDKLTYRNQLSIVALPGY